MGWQGQLIRKPFNWLAWAKRVRFDPAQRETKRVLIALATNVDADGYVNARLWEIAWALDWPNCQGNYATVRVRKALADLELRGLITSSRVIGYANDYQLIPKKEPPPPPPNIFARMMARKGARA